MSDYYDYPSPYLCRDHMPFSPGTAAVLQNAALGATVGAAAATAAHLRRRVPDRYSALNDVLRTGAVTGLTTAAATLVGQSLGCNRPLTRFAAMFATGAALMYLLNPPQSGESA